MEQKKKMLQNYSSRPKFMPNYAYVNKKLKTEKQFPYTKNLLYCRKNDDDVDVVHRELRNQSILHLCPEGN